MNSLQIMSSTTDEVVVSTHHLNENLFDISAFSEQISQSSKQILRKVNQFFETVRDTEDAIQQIGGLLADVADNAEQSRVLARETADAALEGQQAVESSIEGVVELKDIIGHSAQIMHGVNDRSKTGQPDR